MKHASNNTMNELIKIGSMLGVEKEDIYQLKKKASNKEMTNLQILFPHDPTDCYKDPCGGYYGTISINDFQ